MTFDSNNESDDDANGPRVAVSLSRGAKWRRLSPPPSTMASTAAGTTISSGVSSFVPQTPRVAIPELHIHLSYFAIDRDYCTVTMFLSKVTAVLWTTVMAVKYPNEISETPLVLCEPERIVVK
ncbi:unnamed protein product, partial [Cylicostephanus goldi]